MNVKRLLLFLAVLTAAAMGYTLRVSAEDQKPAPGPGSDLTAGNTPSASIPGNISPAATVPVATTFELIKEALEAKLNAAQRIYNVRRTQGGWTEYIIAPANNEKETIIRIQFDPIISTGKAYIKGYNKEFGEYEIYNNTYVYQVWVDGDESNRRAKQICREVGQIVSTAFDTLPSEDVLLSSDTSKSSLILKDVKGFLQSYIKKDEEFPPRPKEYSWGDGGVNFILSPTIGTKFDVLIKSYADIASAKAGFQSYEHLSQVGVSSYPGYGDEAGNWGNNAVQVRVANVFFVLRNDGRSFSPLFLKTLVEMERFIRETLKHPPLPPYSTALPKSRLDAPESFDQIKPKIIHLLKDNTTTLKKNDTSRSWKRLHFEPADQENGVVVSLRAFTDSTKANDAFKYFLREHQGSHEQESKPPYSAGDQCYAENVLSPEHVKILTFQVGPVLAEVRSRLMMDNPNFSTTVRELEKLLRDLEKSDSPPVKVEVPVK